MMKTHSINLECHSITPSCQLSNLKKKINQMMIEPESKKPLHKLLDMFLLTMASRNSSRVTGLLLALLIDKIVKTQSIISDKAEI